jgi:DNA polymerase epsilon subunit 1
MREAHTGDSSGNVVPAMFRGVKVKPVARDWDIVQIRQGRGIGRFIMWICIEESLTPIPLRIPREFYINFKTLPEDAVFQDSYIHELVTKILPHNRPCGHLIKIIVPEFLYREEESHFMNLTDNPNVDTVYERKVSKFAVISYSQSRLDSRCLFSFARCSNWALGVPLINLEKRP